MAPRKKAEERPAAARSGAGEAADAILHYLRRENRPYSANDISANLHNKVTKATAAKILKDLHERNEIEGRTAGKQIVYHVLQNSADGYTPEQLAALDNTINNFRNSTSDFIATAKTLRGTLSSINSTMSTANLRANVSALEMEKAEIVTRLESLKAGKAKMVTKKERHEVEAQWKTDGVVAKRREAIARELWRLIGDNLETAEKKAEVRESLGLDE